MRQQICIIHGGNTYGSNDDYLAALRSKEIAYDRLLISQSWREWLARQLPDYDVLSPTMPNSQNAQYAEWELYFSKVLPHLQSSAILIGHSLGGIFLAKFLTEHMPHDPFAKIILVAAPYDDESEESLGNFKLSSAMGLDKAAREIHILHSTDDPIVPFSESTKYLTDLPTAHIHKFTDRHHFISESFPELLDMLQ